MITNAQPAIGKFYAILCMASMATCSQVSARHPRPRVLSGKIETIDQNARILRIRADGETTLLTLVWSNRTRFIEGDRLAAAAELTKGASVTIWYGTPFIGERYASKIVIGRSAVRPAKRQTPRSFPTPR